MLMKGHKVPGKMHTMKKLCMDFGIFAYTKINLIFNSTFSTDFLKHYHQ